MTSDLAELALERHQLLHRLERHEVTRQLAGLGDSHDSKIAVQNPYRVAHRDFLVAGIGLVHEHTKGP